MNIDTQSLLFGMPDCVPNIEGTLQGSPLSPLLSNVILHELDAKLEERGHQFVRYADDCSIYLRSKKSAYRVMISISVYLEDCLKLKVNRGKSKVSRPSQSSLLGLSFYGGKQGWKIRVISKALRAIKEKIKVQTKSSQPVPLYRRILKLKEIIHGWVNYFSIAEAKSHMLKLDDMMRTRLRIVLWKQWKSITGRARNLMKMGVAKSRAFQLANTRKGYCRTANSPTLLTTLDKKFFIGLGLDGSLKKKTPSQALCTLVARLGSAPLIFYSRIPSSPHISSSLTWFRRKRSTINFLFPLPS